jgi:rubredoxin
MEPQRRCSDCGVGLELTKLRTVDSMAIRLQTGERREGVLGALGMKEHLDVDAWLCPECGRVRLYADLEA